MFCARALGEQEPSTFFRKEGVPRAEMLATLVKPSVLVEPSDARGRTRLGGVPDLAIGRAWPRASDGAPMLFVAQVDLAELGGTPVSDQLPNQGLLAWFYAPVVHGGHQPPELAITWSGAQPVARAEAIGHVLPEHGANLRRWWSIPPSGRESPFLHSLGLTDAERDAWGDFVGEWYAEEMDVRGHRLLGYAENAEAYLAAALDTDEALRTRFFGRSVRDRAIEPYADADLAARAKAFRLLFEVCGDEALGVSWGDGAPTSFMLHEASSTTLEAQSPTSLAATSCFAT